MKKYARVCRGTGGHIAPGIAVAERLLERNDRCILVVGKKEVDGIFLRKYANMERVVFPATPFSKRPFRFLKFFLSQSFSFFKALFFWRRTK
jgi:UDP-N-acetylglucosamine--N-acetylmuramyl-(pentapeptide) pyrophosphoryl-undecaprenol N-acetylglucosamine transferase